MDYLPLRSISLIERDLVKKMVEKYKIQLDCLLFDTTNFFTFIDSGNERYNIPQRGKNKQKRHDLRQIGMSFLVTRKKQFPLFHKTYCGNKNDITVFKEVFAEFVQRLREIQKKVADVTIIFDKGNNSKENFKMFDNEEDLYYVAGLVSSYFKDLIKKANAHFQPIKIQEEEVLVFRTKQQIWAEQRTCVISISQQLKECQIRGINQNLKKNIHN